RHTRSKRDWSSDVCSSDLTAVQLSRGKGEAQLIFEIALLMQDLSRFAADVLLFSTREFGFLALAEEFTTGSSIMPQKRNLDVFRSEERRVGKVCRCWWLLV